MKKSVLIEIEFDELISLSDPRYKEDLLNQIMGAPDEFLHKVCISWDGNTIIETILDKCLKEYFGLKVGDEVKIIL